MDGMTRHHRRPARDVQPPILIPQPCVDDVFPPFRWTAVAADRTLVGRERRFRPMDRVANVLSAEQVERHLLPPPMRTGRNTPSDARRVDVGGSSGLLPKGDAVRGG